MVYIFHVSRILRWAVGGGRLSLQSSVFSLVSPKGRVLMWFHESVVAILGFVAILLVAPLFLGWFVRKVSRARSTGSWFPWVTFSQALVAAGWGLAWSMATFGFMGHAAGILLGALLYVPGLFLLGWHGGHRELG